MKHTCHQPCTVCKKTSDHQRGRDDARNNKKRDKKGSDAYHRGYDLELDLRQMEWDALNS